MKSKPSTACDRKSIVGLLAPMPGTVARQLAEILIEETLDKRKTEITTQDFSQACRRARISRVHDVTRDISDGNDSSWWLYKWHEKGLLDKSGRGRYKIVVGKVNQDHSKNETKNNQPDERPFLCKAPEAAKKTVLVNKYERNAKNKRACLDYHGRNCHICNFNFDDFYGQDIAEGFIEIHHLVPLFQISKKYGEEEYVPDPQTDLIPVCPNCHAMLHYGFSEPKKLPEAQEKMRILKARVEQHRKRNKRP